MPITRNGTFVRPLDEGAPPRTLPARPWRLADLLPLAEHGDAAPFVVESLLCVEVLRSIARGELGADDARAAAAGVLEVCNAH